MRSTRSRADLPSLMADGLEPSGVVTLLTDFGLRDPYLGAMKGVVLARAPRCVLVDLTHDVPPYDVAAAGYLLDQSFSLYPRGTVHLVVVDPGVGTDRRAVLVRTGDHLLVGPDNGCLDPAIERDGYLGAWTIVRSDRLISSTFHGRDLFAPLVGHLAAGRDPTPFLEPGHVVPRRRRSSAMQSGRISEAGLRGRIVWVDRFGNLATSVRREQIPASWKRGLSCRIAGSTIERFARTYGKAPTGVPFLLWGSGGHLEISVREGSAASLLGVTVGCALQLAG